MGKNKDLRKAIRGLEANVWKHKLKIESELRKDYPNERFVAGWRREIKAGEDRIARLKRRLRKERRDMPKVKAKNPVEAEAVEMLLTEMVDEGYQPWVKQMGRLRRAKPGTPAYRDALCELWTLSNIVEIKGKLLGKMIDEYLDTLPDDDDD